jgi:hypothetical protein
MNKLNGKKILFIGSGFYFYDKSIVKEIESYGASVKYTVEFTVSNSLKLKRILSKGVYEKNAITNRENELLDLYKEELLDYVFVIRAQYLSPDFFDKFKKNQKNAIFILYLWDSISTTRDFFIKEKYFDKILSFDRTDSLKYPYIKFRPLFYLNEFYNDQLINKEDVVNDIYFLGRLYGDRISIIRKIKKECELKGLKSELILFAALEGDLIHSLRRYLVKKADFNIVTFKTLSLSENLNKMQKSISILDIELNYQSGLTLRTIESIGANRKLITTNKDIVNYDFYDPSRIFVIDRKTPDIPVDFIRVPMNPYNKIVLEKYGINGWIRDIFN